MNEKWSWPEGSEEQTSAYNGISFSRAGRDFKMKQNCYTIAEIYLCKVLHTDSSRNRVKFWDPFALSNVFVYRMRVCLPLVKKLASHELFNDALSTVVLYAVIKRSLFTWWLQYRKLQVLFKVSSASLQTLLGSIWLLGSRPPGPGGH
jgi:hypothetical protein